MWPSNIGWNADNQMGSSVVGDCREKALSQRSITYGQMQRSSYNVARIVAWVCSIAVAAIVLSDSIPRSISQVDLAEIEAAALHTVVARLSW